MKSINAALVVLAVSMGIVGCDQRNGRTQQASTDDGAAALRSRCIAQAKTQGYRDGACAYSFIDACIKTQSRKEMEAVLRTDEMLGVGTGLSCPNMPTDYVAEFNKLDKF